MMAAMMVQRKGKEKKKKEINLQNRSAEPRQKKNFLMTQSVRIDAADAFLQLAVREIWTLLLFFFSSFLLYANRDSQPLHLLLMFAFKKKKERIKMRYEEKQ